MPTAFRKPILSPSEQAKANAKAFEKAKFVAAQNLENYNLQQEEWGAAETTLRENIFYGFVRPESFQLHVREILENVSEE